MPSKRVLALLVLGVAVLGLAFAASFNSVQPTKAGNGNGAPSGAHYNLNIIGVPRDKSADMTDSNRHVIFVKLEGKSRILLCEAGVDEACADVDGFRVLDGNGTDGEAAFALPNPDPDGDGTTVYSVFARALGTPGGKALMTTCATDPLDGEEVCSVITLELTRDKGKSKFDNVSKYLLYIYADIDEDGNLERLPLFDERLEGYLWDYDNHGLRLAQLRFYECPTTVPDATNPEGPQDDSACFN